MGPEPAPSWVRPEIEVAADAVWALFHHGVLQRTAEKVAYAAQAADVSIAELRSAEMRRRDGAYRRPRPAIALAVAPASPSRVKPGDMHSSLRAPRGADRMRFIANALLEPEPSDGDLSEAACLLLEAAEVVTLPVRPATVPRGVPPTPPPPEPRSPRERAKQPTPEYRMCRGPSHDPIDGALLATSEFTLRNPSSGSRDSLCRACRSLLAQQRRLVVTRLAAIGADAVGVRAAELRFVVSDDDDIGDLCCRRCGCSLEPGEEVSATSALLHVVCP